MSMIFCELGCIHQCAENMHKEKENGKGTLLAVHVSSQHKEVNVSTAGVKHLNNNGEDRVLLQQL